jgi:hypothetical protein
VTGWQPRTGELYENMRRNYLNNSKNENEWSEKKKYKTAKKIAEEHWSYVGRITEMMYKDAFIHGYGHGFEDAKKT